MSDSAGDPLPVAPGGSDVLLAAEAALGASVVEAPAPAPGPGPATLIPGLGYMPAPGHILLSTSPEQRIVRYLFAR